MQNATGATKAPAVPDAPCRQFQAASCSSQAQQLEASFKANASLRLGLPGGRQASSKQSLINLQSYWQVGLKCANAADAQDSRMESGHQKGMTAFEKINPSLEKSGKLATEREFGKQVKQGEVCDASAGIAIQQLGVCNEAFGVAKADQQVGQAIAEGCARDVKKLQYSLKNFVDQLYRNNELKSKKSEQLNAVHAEWESLDKNLTAMSHDDVVTVGVAVAPAGFPGIALSLQLSAAQNRQGGECGVSEDAAIQVRPACVGNKNFAEANLGNEKNKMPDAVKVDSQQTGEAPADPAETSAASKEKLPDAPTASESPKEEKTNLAATEPQQSYPYGINPNQNPFMSPQANAERQQLEQERAQLEKDKSNLEQQIAEAKQGLQAAGQQAAQQAAQQGGDHGDAQQQPQQQQQQAKAEPAKTPSTEDAAAKARLAQLEDELKKKKDEIAAKDKELKDTAAPFSQDAPKGTTTAQTNTNSGNGNTVVASGSNSGSNNQALASSGTTTSDAAQPAVGRGLASAVAGTFTAFKLDCNTGLGKCSKIPIACGSSGLSADDQTSCKNEAAKRDAKKKRALSSEFLK